MQIVLVAVLVSWLALGLLAVGLLNVAKKLVRISARAKDDAVVPAAKKVSSVDVREGDGRSFARPPLRHPGSVALPPPSSRRMS